MSDGRRTSESTSQAECLAPLSATFVRTAGAASARNGEVADAGPHENDPARAARSLYGHGRVDEHRSRNATPSSSEACPSSSSPACPPSSRAEATTLVRASIGNFAYADTMAVSDPSLLEGEGTPDWCIDLGERLLTVTTFDAWSAIARGEVRSGMRAWREGLECWTPVEDLVELACALSAEPTPAPVATDLTPPDSLSALTLAPLTASDPAPPPSGIQMAAASRLAALRRPATFGALVAAAAVLVAAFRPAAAASASPTARTPEAMHAGLEMIASKVTVAALAAAVGDDKGQRRLRRSGR